MISTDLEAKPPTFQVVALVSHDSEELPYYEDLNHKNEWRWIQCKDRDLGVVQLDPAAVTPSGVSKFGLVAPLCGRHHRKALPFRLYYHIFRILYIQTVLLFTVQCSF